MSKLPSFLLVPLLAAAQVSVPRMSDPSASNLPAQKIGDNDLLAISVYDAPELTRTVRVSADGAIRLPMLKQLIPVNGLMPSEVEAAVADALKEEGLIVDPFVSVTVAEYHSRPISIMGAVKKPTTFQAAGPMTLLEVLSRAEGLAPDAGPEILVSRRSGGQALLQRIAVRGLIDQADADLNLTLTGGEEVRVPEAGKVFVVGNVKKPGAFLFQDNQETTVLKALALSEGLLPYANKQAWILRPSDGGKKSEIAVELKQILARKSPDVPLLPNDVLYVPDAKGTRAGLAALEKALMFGGGVTSALIYAGVR